MIAALLAGLLAALSAVHAHHQRHAKPKLPADYAAWTRVARCESGGWVVLGPDYADSIGMTTENFEAFGGRPLPVGPVSLRSRVMTIRVADRFRAYYRIPIPDQQGCAAW